MQFKFWHVINCQAMNITTNYRKNGNE